MSTKLMTLGTVATYVNGRAFKPSEWEPSGLPIIRIQNLTDGNATYNYSSAKHDERFKVKNGDLLFAWSASLGAHIWSGEDAWLNQHIFRVIPAPHVDKMYLYYYLCNVVTDLYSKTHGSGMVHITKAPFMATPIPVPSIEQQKYIVSRIEELFSELDKAVETLQKTKQQLAVYQQAVLKEAFSTIDKYIAFGNISDARLGKMLDKEKNTGIPRSYLRNINVRWFAFNTDDLLEMRINDDEVEKFSICSGDLVVCEGGEPGRCAVWNYDYSIFYQKALHRVRFKDGSNPKFYMFFLRLIAQTGELGKYFTGSGIKHLTGQSLEKIIVPTVERQYQDRIVEKIESQLSICDNIEKTVDSALAQANAMWQSILKQAFGGNE